MLARLSRKADIKLSVLVFDSSDNEPRSHIHMTDKE